MTQYKADLKEDLQVTIVCMALLAVTFLLSSELSIAGCILFSFFLSIVILVNLFSTRLVEIQIDRLNNTLTLIYGNYFKEIKLVNYYFQRLEYTYKKEKTSFRGSVKDVCSIYYGDKRIAKLIPGDNGWDDGDLNSFVYELVDLGVKKRFVGYLLKDVEI